MKRVNEIVNKLTAFFHQATTYQLVLPDCNSYGANARTRERVEARQLGISKFRVLG